MLTATGRSSTSGDWVQVSRLGNPLINEVVIPLGQKDLLELLDPADDSQFLDRYTSPELAGLVNFLYPVLPDTPTTRPRRSRRGAPHRRCRAQLHRLDAGGPSSPEHGGRADEKPEPLGALAGDLQGFPNGRRLADDVTDIEVRAVACGYGSFLAGLLGLCNLSPNNTLNDGVDKNEGGSFLKSFPYVAAPNQGYEHTGHK